jgi:hypothetical protein
MEFGEGVLVVVDGNDNRQDGHGPLSVSADMSQGTPSTLTGSPWAGPSPKVASIGIAGAVTWWTFSLWLFWGYRPRYDDFYHTLWARWWIEGNVSDLLRNWLSTFTRPYLYRAALGVVGNIFPDVLTSEWTRPTIAAIQVATFSAVTFHLARAVARFERGLPRAVILGLLCAPFAVLTNTEVLSESISLMITCMLVAVACPIGTSRVGRLGNATVVLACFALLAMTRTAHLAASVAASAAIVLLLEVNGAQQAVPRRERAVHFAMTGLGLAAWVVVVAPQAWLLW